MFSTDAGRESVLAASPATGPENALLVGALAGFRFSEMAPSSGFAFGPDGGLHPPLPLNSMPAINKVQKNDGQTIGCEWKPERIEAAKKRQVGSGREFLHMQQPLR